MSETRVLLLRHAETSAPDRFHGAESDIGLGDRGHRQALFLAEYLAAFRPDALSCSPLRRARETAGPIAEACGLMPTIIEWLHERQMGGLSGRDKVEGWADYTDELNSWMAGDLDFTGQGGESYAQVRDRALPAIAGLVDGPLGRTIVVVAHGVLIRIVLSSLLPDHRPADLDRIGIDNGALNDLRWDGRSWRAVALNQRPPGLP